MFGDRTVRYTILCGGLLLVMPGCQRAPSPDELAQQALKAASPDEQELAAVALAQLANDDELKPQFREKAKQHLRTVLAESPAAPVRAACIQGLASQWDYESMPALLDALDDESSVVRSRAGVAVERMMSVDFGFRHDDPPAMRQDTAKRLRGHWETWRESANFENWTKRLKEKQS